MSQPRVTVTYAGNLVDASQTDGKIRFAVDGQAVLSRELRYTRSVQDKPVRAWSRNVLSPTDHDYLCEVKW